MLAVCKVCAWLPHEISQNSSYSNRRTPAPNDGARESVRTPFHGPFREGDAPAEPRNTGSVPNVPARQEPCPSDIWTDSWEPAAGVGPLQQDSCARSAGTASQSGNPLIVGNTRTTPFFLTGFTGSGVCEAGSGPGDSLISRILYCRTFRMRLGYDLKSGWEAEA